ncbi:MAG: fructose-6-phosphate aldolase [Bacteroidetes bacterium]|nr:fructose-6-phosphate aldolase [Bacteroidota bacterium]
MIYLADTADTEELRKLFYYFPLEGITTNPTILKAVGKPLSVIIPELQEIVGDKMIHIQMYQSKHQDIVAEAKFYKKHFNLGDNFYVKVPVTAEGYKAIPILKKEGFKVTATAIFTQQQALVAARAGADFVAPYVNRLDNISSHGIEVVGYIVENINTYQLPTRVLAASFKTVDQVHRVSIQGCHSATISYEILERLRSHPMTDMSVDGFDKDGEGIYDLDIR